MTQPFEDFLVEVHNNAKNRNEDDSTVLGRIRHYLDEHLAGRGAATATERNRLAVAFRDKGLTTDLSRGILDVVACDEDSHL